MSNYKLNFIKINIVNNIILTYKLKLMWYINVNLLIRFKNDNNKLL